MGSRFNALVMMLVVAGALLLASCGGPSSPTTTDLSKEGPTTTKPYGSLTVVTLFGTSQLDPQASSSETFLALGLPVFDTLLRYTDDDVATAGIAERWEISPDGLTQTFYIRREVKFHNGDDLTGADVKFSIDRAMLPESVESDAPTWRSTVASVDLKDEYTVLIRFKAPQYDMMLSIDGGMTAVVPKKYIEDKGVEYFRKNPIGSGPYKFVSMQVNSRIELEALESHWRAAPKFKTIILLNVAEESTKVAMLKTGELDMAAVAPDSIAALKAAGVRIVDFDRGTDYYAIPFYDVEHPEKYALGDVKVRQAVQLAINAKEIGDKLLNGYGAPLALYGAMQTAYFWDKNILKADPFDPEGAKKLLGEAGYPNGFDTRLWDVGGGDMLSTIDQSLAGYWRKVGINVQIVPIDFATFRLKYNPKHLPEIWNSIWPYRAINKRNFEGMRSAFHSTQGVFKNHNYTKLNEMIEKVPTLRDSPEKTKLALDTVVLAKSTFSVLPIVNVFQTVAVSPKIGVLTNRVHNIIRGNVYEGINHPK
ncbi:MAG: ABC transporter substrate-binding protein [Dehalococcoidia bacterium]|nr:ABC transporter substrate-binding protein [Dehalococcoidia bacterium]